MSNEFQYTDEDVLLYYYVNLFEVNDCSTGGVQFGGLKPRVDGTTSQHIPSPAISCIKAPDMKHRFQ